MYTCLWHATDMINKRPVTIILDTIRHYFTIYGVFVMAYTRFCISVPCCEQDIEEISELLYQED